MKRILVVAGGYLPGYKAGGPIRSLANLVESLGDEFEFRLLAADRDLGDRNPFPGVLTGVWQTVGKASVMYLSPQQMGIISWCNLLRTIDYDVVYLNSYFSPLTIKTLVLRRLRLIPRKPVILAPRGEFSPGALAMKWTKKRVYIAVAKLLSLYGGICWQASSEYERADIISVFAHLSHEDSQPVAIAPDLLGKAPIQIAPDLLSRGIEATRNSEFKAPGNLEVVFLSRISRKKNLDVALRMLHGISGQVHFDIYGPIEDEDYWSECQALIARLPTNVRARYLGALLPDRVISALSNYHLFLFPTRGENFGHVIWEALSAGCLLLVSDQTPWRSLLERGVGWDLPLSEPDRFRTAIEEVLSLDQAAFASRSRASHTLAKEWAANSDAVEANRQLFLKALEI